MALIHPGAIYDINRDMYVTNGTTGLMNAQQAYNNAMMGQQQAMMSSLERERQIREYDAYMREQAVGAKQEQKKLEAREPVLDFMSNPKTKVLLTEGE